jgi:integrase/recombinase XerC
MFTQKMLTYTIYPRVERINKMGLCLFYVQVTSNRIVNRFKLPISVEMKHYDEKHNKVKSSHATPAYMNSILDKYKKEANEIIMKCVLGSSPLSYRTFKDTLLGVETPVSRDDNNGDFFVFIKKRLNESNFRYNTQRSYGTLYNLLKLYRPKLKFEDIDYAFVIGFKNFLKTSRNNIENSCSKKLAMLRALIYEAMRQGLMTENPFKQIQLRRTNSHRLFLEMHEVEKLQKIYDKDGLKYHQLNILQYFLFACYTGLRFSDVEQFSTDMIVNDKISIQTEKTKETVVIPLIPQARHILPKCEKQFNVISNQKTNAGLKEIMKAAEINKPIHFHCARHTFATIAISSGIPIEVISKLLGHNDLKTTSIYAKIMDDVKVDSMKQWGKKRK